MVATLLTTFFAAAALLAVGAMIRSWLTYGFRFGELRAELRNANHPLMVRYAWHDRIMRPSAIIYNLDFRAKAEGLPFHPNPRGDLALPVAA